MDSVSYILYYVPNNSIGCENALNIINEHVELKKEVFLQNIYLLEKKPDWLRGVPVLAKRSTRETWQGTVAIEQLQYLANYLNNNKPPALSQPWQQYQSNLALPHPVSIDSSVLSPPPNQQQQHHQQQQQTQSPLPNQQQQQQTQQQPQQTQLPPPNQQQPQTQPLTQPLNQPLTLQNFPTNKTEKKSLNKIQPLPPPDDERNEKPLSLPPLPKKIKNNTNQINTNQINTNQLNTNQLNNNQLNTNQLNTNQFSNLNNDNLNNNINDNNTNDNSSLTTNNKPFELFSSQEINKIQNVLSKSPNNLNHTSDTLQVNIDLDVNNKNNVNKQELVAS